MARSVKQIIKAFKVNMGGFIVQQALPVNGINQIDPFLLLHHAVDEYKPGTQQQTAGVGPHPHRGFAPVTFIFKGGVHHRDSLDISSVIYEGGTQWMHSGKGIVHSERPPKEVAEAGEVMEIVQFWVNVPANRKMTEPNYQPLTYEDTPNISEDDGKVYIGVVTGEYQGKQGLIKAETDILALRINLKKGGKTKIPVAGKYNTFIYQLDGQLKVNGQHETKTHYLVWFQNEDGEIELEAMEDTRVMLLAGTPINEPVATYGPFVMNTEEEITQAIQDYQMGEMGILNEVFE